MTVVENYAPYESRFNEGMVFAGQAEQMFMGHGMMEGLPGPPGRGRGGPMGPLSNGGGPLTSPPQLGGHLPPLGGPMPGAVASPAQNSVANVTICTM